ncbi:hypothetical protein P9160_01125 [Bacillus halotolerans]|uniref:hypothetical protein n=1 Tax=Bacillus halotolerans TaxID=260554 RepID=UPI002DB77035|nr:hypothetical protein [Bacillus halotolerans]MEC3756030.1 hypothetical protein [Bacillus halotolerans]
MNIVKNSEEKESNGEWEVVSESDSVFLGKVIGYRRVLKNGRLSTNDAPQNIRIFTPYDVKRALN